MDRILIKHRVDLGLTSTVASVDDLLSLLVKDDYTLCLQVPKTLSCELSCQLSLTNNHVYYVYYFIYCSYVAISSTNISIMYIFIFSCVPCRALTMNLDLDLDPDLYQAMMKMLDLVKHVSELRQEV